MKAFAFKRIRQGLPNGMNNFPKALILVVVASFSIALQGMAKTVTAKQNGSWTSASTWDLPPINPGDVVVIPSGYTVTIQNAKVFYDGDLTVNGTLRLKWTNGGNDLFSDFAALEMDETSKITVPAGGKIASISNAKFFGAATDYNFISIGSDGFGLPNPVYSPFWKGDSSSLNGPVGNGQHWHNTPADSPRIFQSKANRQQNFPCLAVCH